MKIQVRFVALLGGLLVSTVGCHRPPEAVTAAPALPAVSVRVHSVSAGKHQAVEETVGTVRARLQARIEAKVSGRILELRATPGQVVKAGELLVRLDVEEIQARWAQAQEVQQQADRDLKRFTLLKESATATPAEFEAVRSRARVAGAAVTEAQSLLAQGQIAAPFAGVVTRKLADVGDLAGPGKALLELEDATSLRFETDVGEALAAHLQLGQSLALHLPTLAKSLTGTVSEIAPTVDPTTRTFVVKLDLPATPGLRAGAFGRVAIPVGESPILRVPSTAVTLRGQLESVFLVVDGRAQLRLVRTGKSQGDETELLAGVTAGESVVVSAATPLRDGQPVQVAP